MIWRMDKEISKIEFPAIVPEMEFFYRSYLKSSHYQNRKNQIITCVHCHLNSTIFLLKWFNAPRFVNHIYMHFTNIPDQKYWEKERARWPETVPSNACMKCHHYSLYGSGISDVIARAHKHVQENSVEMACVHCHGGSVHGLPGFFDLEKISAFIQNKNDVLQRDIKFIDQIKKRYCISCHSPETEHNKLGNFALEKAAMPEDYLILKLAVQKFSMPPSLPMREKASKDLNTLTNNIEGKNVFGKQL